MKTAGNLAIKLNHTVNNTSLVLALELVENGKVLLFPGDAQAESWYSWHEEGLSWDAGEDEVTARDLLERTVYYKTSHHGSHNGTVKSLGLEMMDDPGLVAAIPVGDNKFGHPSAEVLEALLRKTKGRVIRSDEAVTKDQPSDISPEDWDYFNNCLT